MPLPRQYGLVISLFASHAVGCGFMPWLRQYGSLVCFFAVRRVLMPGQR